jgi:succinyl-CoA synthetase alpha subunit
MPGLFSKKGTVGIVSNLETLTYEAADQVKTRIRNYYRY